MKNKYEKLIFIYILCLPFIDLITSLSARFLNFPFSVGMLIKTLFLVFLVYYILFLSKSIHRKKSIIYIFIIFIYGLLYFLTKQDVFKFEFLISEITYLFKFFSFSVFFIGLLNIVDTEKIGVQNIKKALVINFINYAVFILIPYLTGTAFSTYDYVEIGTIGWFYSANEISVILVILLPFVYALIGKKKTCIFILLLNVFIISLVGTKVSMLGCGLIAIFMLIKYLINKNKEASVLALIIVVFSLILTFNTSMTENITNTLHIINTTPTETSDEKSQKEYQKITNSNSGVSLNIFAKILSEPTISKYVKLIFSDRDKYFLDIYDIYSAAPIKDKLLGIGFSNRASISDERINKMIEIDFLDIMLRYGVIGLSILLFPFYWIIESLTSWIINRKKRKENVYNNRDIFLYLFVIFLSIGISCAAGHVLGAPSVSIYLVLIMILFIIECNWEGTNNANKKNGY